MSFQRLIVKCRDLRPGDVYITGTVNLEIVEIEESDLSLNHRILYFGSGTRSYTHHDTNLEVWTEGRK